eukprot:8900311-Lingulodinium_polyedra.AAC.1
MLAHVAPAKLLEDRSASRVAKGAAPRSSLLLRCLFFAVAGSHFSPGECPCAIAPFSSDPRLPVQR